MKYFLKIFTNKQEEAYFIKKISKRKSNEISFSETDIHLYDELSASSFIKSAREVDIEKNTVIIILLPNSFEMLLERDKIILINYDWKLNKI